MSTVAIVQARIGSERLPGKVMTPLAGEPLLNHVVRRAQQCAELDRIVVATTESPADDVVVEQAQRLGVASFRGSEGDVLDRYYGASREHGVSTVVRLTADCPLLDPQVIGTAVRRLKGDPALDYVATGETFPEGYAVEAMTFPVLERAWREAALASEREHVTAYIWKNPGKFRLAFIELPEDCSAFRLTVDEPVDLEVVRALCESFRGAAGFFGVQAAIGYLRQHPEVAKLNAHIRRRAGYLRSLAKEKS